MPTELDDSLQPRPVVYQVGKFRVEDRGAGAWAVVDGASCLNRDGEWEYEPLPSSRTQAFFDRCRYPKNEAIQRAQDIQQAVT